MSEIGVMRGLDVGRQSRIFGGFKLVLVMLLAWPWSLAMGACAGVSAGATEGRRESRERGKAHELRVSGVIRTSASDETAVLQSESEESEEGDSTGLFGMDLSWLATCARNVRRDCGKSDFGRGIASSEASQARCFPLRC